MILLPPEGQEQMPTWASVVLYVVFTAQVAFIVWLAWFHRWLNANPALNDRVMGEGYTVRQTARIETDAVCTMIHATALPILCAIMTHWRLW